MNYLVCRECSKLAPLHLQSKKFQKEFAKKQKLLHKLDLLESPFRVILSYQDTIPTRFCWGGGEDTYYLVEQDSHLLDKNPKLLERNNK